MWNNTLVLCCICYNVFLYCYSIKIGKMRDDLKFGSNLSDLPIAAVGNDDYIIMENDKGNEYIHMR